MVPLWCCIDRIAKGARTTQLKNFVENGIKMRCKHFLAVIHPTLHVGPALVDVAVCDPVLGDFSEELQVRNGDLVSGYEFLAVLQEVVFHDVEGFSQRCQGLCALSAVPGTAVLYRSKSL